MKIQEIQEQLSYIIPDINQVESYDMLQPFIEILKEIKGEFIEGSPTVKRNVSQSFDIVIEILKDNYGK